VRVIGYRYQRTLAGAATVAGVGFVTGARSVVRFLPAGPDTGRVFRRVDRPDRPTTPALTEYVTGTQRRTTLGTADGGVTLVEHVLAALAGLRVDNCVIELDAAEPPGLDGSAAGFVEAVAAAGVALQPSRRPIYTVAEPVVVRNGGATLAMHPATTPEFRVSYRLDYGAGAPISPQTHTAAIRPETFRRDIAACRTFLTEAEAHELRRLGVGRHLTGSDLLVFGRGGPIDNRTRYADEPARHKVLDLVGDLALCPFDVAGHAVAYRSGHAMNVDLARALVGQVASRPVESRKAARPIGRAA
jgi:UDP-3-O-acyl N-acetylglucosamine deacetylase